MGKAPTASSSSANDSGVDPAPRVIGPSRPGLRVKRALDVLLAACGLVGLSPLLAVVAVAIRVTMGSPVLFRQERPGWHGRPFVLLKFRSMTDAQDADGERLPEDRRRTRFGVLIRRTSIDELPGLWNVLKGEMSMVGPRPLPMEYLPHYSEEQMRRHDVRPGLTGLAQIAGRHALGWEERFALDLRYVDHRSLRLDARIMLETFRVLLSGQDHVDPDDPDYIFRARRRARDRCRAARASRSTGPKQPLHPASSPPRVRMMRAFPPTYRRCEGWPRGGEARLGIVLSSLAATASVFGLR